MPLINPGSPAPDFTLPDQNRIPFRSVDHRGSPLVLYFYPKDDTPACTDEACAFSAALAAFAGSGAPVIGISPDDPASHARFAAKFKLKLTLLSDTPDARGVPTVADSFGAWGQKSMYGKTYQGLIRTTYLIDARGVVRFRWDKVRVRGHAQAVLEEVRRLATPSANNEARPGKRKNAALSAARRPVAKKAAKKPSSKTVRRPAPKKPAARRSAR